MKACTIQQPHVCAIAAGWKPTENRGRNLSYRGEVALHSGLTVSDYALPDRAATLAFHALGGYPGLWRPSKAGPAGHPLLALGAVIAVADLVDVHPATAGPDRICCAPWGQAQHGTAGRPAHHLVLANVRTLPRPVPCSGKQILPWDLPPDVAAAVRAQLADPTAGLVLPEPDRALAVAGPGVVETAAR